MKYRVSKYVIYNMENIESPINQYPDPALEPKNDLVNNKTRTKKNLITISIAVLAIAIIAIVGFAQYFGSWSLGSAEVCAPGEVFNEKTGEPCNGEMPAPCETEGDVYNRDTGE